MTAPAPTMATQMGTWFKDLFMPYQTTYANPLDNYWNINYVGELYMGSNQQKFMVVWDTGSSALLLESSECDNCNGDVLQIEDSTSFAWADPQESKSEEYMDGTAIGGFVAFDKACATAGTDSSCAIDFEFVALNTQSGLSDYEDGILGMWSGITDSADQSEMFMNGLMANGGISEKTFSFYLTGVDGDSYIDFGAPNESVMDGDITWIEINETSDWWTSDLTSFRFDSTHRTTGQDFLIRSGVTEALTDTGTSCMTGPKEDMEFIIDQIIAQIEETVTVYTDDDWGYQFECPDGTPQLNFEVLYGGYWMEVKPEDYLIDISIDDDRSLCAVCLEADPLADHWILGDAFMRGWYNIHDHENKRMGFVPFIGSTKSAPTPAESSDVPDPSASDDDVVVDEEIEDEADEINN